MEEFERIAIDRLENELRRKIYGVIKCKLSGDNAVTLITDSDGYKWKYTTKNFLTSVASGIPIPSVADMIVKTFTKQIIRKFIIQSKRVDKSHNI